LLNAAVPWAEPHGRFTLLFEAFAIHVLQAAASVEQARRLLRLDGDDLDRRLARLEHLPDAGDRPAGADARDDDVDGAVIAEGTSLIHCRKHIKAILLDLIRDSGDH
jgi:hypothetical protein